MTDGPVPDDRPVFAADGSTRGVDVDELDALNAGSPGANPAGPRRYTRERRGEVSSLPVIVRVRHCSLEHAPYRLLVGHFQGLPLSGAESRLNERSEGRLERLLLMNQYPQLLGETVVLEPVDEAPPQGIVIIGLGPSGELSAAGLRSAVTRALVRVALNELDIRLAAGPPSAGSPWRPLGISTVLIGSSEGGGLPVESSVRALIDAVTTANARLARLRVFSRTEEVAATDVVRFDVVEITERYEDRVDLIVGVMALMQKLENQDAAASEIAVPRVTYVLAPQSGEGASNANPPIDAADEVWRRIDIRSPQRTSSSVARIEYTSIGRLARAERLLVEIERSIIEPLLAQAVHRPDDPDISGTLYELLIPQELKGELGSAENLHLLVDNKTADWPFELLRPRADEEDRRIPMALRVGVLRQFRETERLRYNVRRASGNNALVIGNPPTRSAAQLRGATAESLASARVLGENGFTVDSLIWDIDREFVGRRPAGSRGTEPIDALHALLNGDWRVLHIAAHGEFTDDPATTGVLLDELHLTANTFSKMSVVPDLVLLNACHLGRVEAPSTLNGANRKAASVGRALLALGVRAVVVAGWAVDDLAAEQFAARLLGGLGEGEDLGHAVTHARRAAWKQAPQSLTWGAYQCYGDPGFSLALRPRRTRSAVHTVGELRRRTRRLASTASDQGRSAATTTTAGADEIRAELRNLEERAVTLKALEIFADLAEVWADLLEFDEAIRLYREALAQGAAGTPVKTIEQLGNLLSRRARHNGQSGALDAKNQKEATDWLKLALELGRSGERLALMGGFHKRTAAMSRGDDRVVHLRLAIASYREAYKTSNKQYHELNCRQLVGIARLNGITFDESAVGGVEAGGAPAPSAEDAPSDGSPVSQAETASDFWQRAATGDLLLTAIIEAAAGASSDSESEPSGSPPDLAEGFAALEAAYEAAFRLRSNRRERASVTEHIRDLVDLAPTDGALAPFNAVRDRLERWPEKSSPGDGSDDEGPRAP